MKSWRERDALVLKRPLVPHHIGMTEDPQMSDVDRNRRDRFDAEWTAKTQTTMPAIVGGGCGGSYVIYPFPFRQTPAR